MKLNELHVEQFRARMIRQRNAVAGAFPGIAGHRICAAQTAGAKDNRLRFENAEATALTVVTKRADDAATVFQQRDDGVFHENRDALMDAVVLERSYEFKPRAVADVRQTRITMAAEIALRDFAFLRAVEHRAPLFQFVNARWCFLGVQFGHAPVVDVLPAAHCVGEMDLPVVAVIHVAHGRRHAAFGHDGMRLAEE